VSSRRLEKLRMKTRTAEGIRTPLHEVEDEGDIIKVTLPDDHHGASGPHELIQLQTADGQVLSVTTASVTDATEGDLLGDTGGGGSAGVSGAVVRSGVDVSDISGLDNIWSAGDNALRDFLVYLVRKHHIDEVYDSKVKAANWDKLVDELHETTDNMVGVSKAQVIRKWHNWKQYNKQHGKPHPFVVVGDVVVDDIMQRVATLVASAKSSPRLAQYLAKGGETPFAVVPAKNKASSQLGRLAALGGSGGQSGVLPFVEKVKKLRTGRDFRVRRTGVSAMSLTLKKLEHEIALESLNYEQEKWRVKVTNNKLLGEKLAREQELAEMKLEQAKIELAIKQHQCTSLNIPLPS